MKTLLRMLPVLSLSAFAVAANGGVESDADVFRVTTPKVGVQHTIARHAAMAEGFSAKFVEHTDVAMLDYTIHFPTRGGLRLPTENGGPGYSTITSKQPLLLNKDGWHCTKGGPKQISRRFAASLCFADMDKDGKFDRAALDGSNKKLRMSDGLSYRKLESWRELVPTEDLKKVLIFKKFKDETLHVELIEFEVTPNRSKNKRTVEIPLASETGSISVEGVDFDIHLVTKSELVMTRTGGSL